MKNLKMFAIAVMAFAVMAMGVHATDEKSGIAKSACTVGSVDNCVAHIGDLYYTDIVDAFTDVEANQTIELLKDATLSNAATVKAAVTVKLNQKYLILNAGVTVDEGGSLTINGTGGLKGSVATAFTVNEGGKLTTSGTVVVDSTASYTTLFAVAGELTVGSDTTLRVATNGTIVNVTGTKANVTLNGKLGTKGGNAAATLIGVDGSLTVGAFDTVTSKVTIAGGTYYTTKTLVDVTKGLTVVVNDGTFDVNDASQPAFIVTDGKLEFNKGTVTAEGNAVKIVGGTTEINGGTLTAVDKAGIKPSAIVVSSTASEGTLSIKDAKVVSKTYYALSFLDGDVKPTIKSGTFESGAGYSAIFITNTLLTGLGSKNPTDDVFKGMLIGGSFANSIVGKATNIDDDTALVSAEDVAKYLMGEGITSDVKEGYVVLTGGSSDEPETQEPGTTEPGEQTPGESNPNVPDVPKTSDALFVYAGLGLVSALSVKFSSKRKED